MQKWVVEFFKKIENRGIKIARVYSILINKSTNLLEFCTVFVRCDLDIFKLTARS